MDKLEIFISSFGKTKRLLIDASKCIVIDDNVAHEISPTKIVAFYRIVSDWKELYNGNSLSEERFVVKIFSRDGLREIKGNGSFPSNYFEFKKWIDTLYS